MDQIKQCLESYEGLLCFLGTMGIYTVERASVLHRMAEAWNDPSLDDKRWDALGLELAGVTDGSDPALTNWSLMGQRRGFNGGDQVVANAKGQRPTHMQRLVLAHLAELDPNDRYEQELVKAFCHATPVRRTNRAGLSKCLHVMEDKGWIRITYQGRIELLTADPKVTSSDD